MLHRKFPNLRALVEAHTTHDARLHDRQLSGFAASSLTSVYSSYRTVLLPSSSLSRIIRVSDGLGGTLIQSPEWQMLAHRFYCCQQIASGIGFHDVASGARFQCFTHHLR